MTRNILYPLFAALFIFSCNVPSSTDETLKEAASLMEEHPDSALYILQNIENKALYNKALKAEHSLLLSMALDKNFIDKTDFEVLQPAIDYYDKRGTSTDKLRTFYYQGRIYSNQNDIPSSIMSYKRAIKEGEASEDTLSKARAHVALGKMYNSLYHFKEYTEENIKAAEYFKTTGYSVSYYNCLLRIISGYIITENIDLCEKYIDECRSNIDKLNTKQLKSFYTSLINYADTKDKSDEYIREIYKEYILYIPTEHHNILDMALMLYKMNDMDSALNLLKTKFNKITEAEKHNYYALLSSIHEQMGNHIEGWKADKQFRHIEDSLSYVMHHHDIMFIDEQHKQEIQNIRESETKSKIIYAAVICMLCLMTAIIYIRGKLKNRSTEKALLEQEFQRYKLQYQQLESEKENLTELLMHNKTLSADARQALDSRISLLSAFFKSYIINDSEINRQLDNEMAALINDRDNFMKSTRLAFSGSHPEFMIYLKSKGLTDWEMDYCCLYALGLNGKDISAYLNMPSHYHASKIIRKKLGLDSHDTNLGIHIKKLMITLC